MHHSGAYQRAICQHDSGIQNLIARQTIGAHEVAYATPQGKSQPCTMPMTPSMFNVWSDCVGNVNARWKVFSKNLSAAALSRGKSLSNLGLAAVNYEMARGKLKWNKSSGTHLCCRLESVLLGNWVLVESRSMHEQIPMS